MSGPACVLDRLRKFTQRECAAISDAFETFCTSEGSKMELVVVTGLAGKPFSEYVRVSEWLMCNETIFVKCRPGDFYFKSATEFRSDAVSLSLVSCGDRNTHAVSKMELSAIVSNWGHAIYPIYRLNYTLGFYLSGNIIMGQGQRDPDVVVSPLRLARTNNRYPRLIVEVENNNRRVSELRSLVHHYFSADEEKCLRAVLAIKISSNDCASAVLYERDATDAVIVTGHFDFGRNADADEKNNWSEVIPGLEYAPPAPNPMHRYIANPQWPEDIHVNNPDWMPEAPIVTIPHAQILYNIDLDPAKVAPELVDLKIDLGLVRLVSARS
jgi:hypothetical protein